MPSRSRLAVGFRLGEWVVKPEDGSLASSATAVRLEPLLMDLLVYLCSRAGHVVPKQDVLDTVWGGRYVSDETIKGSFYQLRKALGDDPRQPRFIETLPKRGYRVLIQPSPLDTACEKGREALSAQPSEASLRQARLYFERALEAEPDNADALSGLAHAYVLLVTAGAGRGPEIWPHAEQAAARALRINSELSEAHWALGMVFFAHLRDFAAAETEFRRAIDLDPRGSLARCWYARLLAAQARHDDAIAEARRAVESDPLSLPVRRDLLEILLLARHYDETVEEARKLFDIAPDSPDVHFGMVWVHYLRRDPQRAFDSFARGMRALGIAPAMIDQARDLFGRSGMTAILHLWAGTLEREAALGQKNQLDLAGLYALLGDNDRCFDLIGRLLEYGHPSVLSIPVSPLFDGIRSDPRYPNVFPTAKQPLA